MRALPDIGQTRFSQIRIRVLNVYEFDEATKERLEVHFPGTADSVSGVDRRTFPKPTILTFSTAGKGANFSISLCIEQDWSVKIDDLSLEYRFSENFASVNARDVEERIEKSLNALLGLHIFVECDCGFEMNSNDLPPGGIIRRGIGAQADFGHDKLRLAGGKFAINGDINDAVSWFLDPHDPEPDWCAIQGLISFRAEQHVSTELFTDLVEMACTKFDRYVLETRNTRKLMR